MVVAALGLLVAGVIYLKPSIAPPDTASTAAGRAPAATPEWMLIGASFADSNHGTVELHRSESGPNISFLTFDGGRSWRQAGRVNGFALAAFIDSWTAVKTMSNVGEPSDPAAPMAGHAGLPWRFRIPRHRSSAT